MPVGDSKVTISSRNLKDDEIDFKVKFSNGPSESRKSKLKKVAVPILTFVLLKVITLVPLGLGILGIKAFNALQLSFFSFVISVGLAVFQLCRKVCICSFYTLPYNDHLWKPSNNTGTNAFLVSLFQFSEQPTPTIASAAWDSRGFVEVPLVNEASQDIAYNAYNL